MFSMHTGPKLALSIPITNKPVWVYNSHMSSRTVWVLRIYLVKPPYAVIQNEAAGEVVEDLSIWI